MLSLCALAEKRSLLIWGRSVGPEEKGREAVVQEFERRHPDIHVNMFNLGAGEMDPQKLMTAIVGKVPPDLIYQDRFSIADWASRGAFLKLDDFVKRDMADPNSPHSSRFYPAAWSECQFQGSLFAIPQNVDDRILYWNRAMFRAKAKELRSAGLDPDRAPRTWSELLAYSKVLSEFNPDGSIKVAGFIPNFGNSWLYLYAFQANANFLDSAGRNCNLAGAEEQEALAFMKAGYDLLGGWKKVQLFQTGPQAGLGNPFLKGLVAMKIDGDWTLSDSIRFGPEFEAGAAPPPVPDDRYYHRGRYANSKDTFVTWSGGFSWAIPSGARHAEDAWTFIKWVTSEEAVVLDATEQRKWDRRRGREPVPRMSARPQANQALYDKFKPTNPVYAACWKQHMDLLPSGRFRPSTFVGQLLWDAHAAAVDKACSGELGVKEALQEGQDRVQRELDRVYSRESYPDVWPYWPLLLTFVILGVGGAGWFVIWRKAPLSAYWRHRARSGAWFLAPWIFGFAVFTLYPMVTSLFYAFSDTNAMNNPKWVGMRNFAELNGAEKERVTHSLVNVFTLAGFGVPLGIFTGLSIALLLESKCRGIKVYRTFFYIPSIVPGIASSVLWLWLLTPKSDQGLVNRAWVSTIEPWLHLPPPAWLMSADWAKPAFVTMGLWGAGGGLVMWLAALKALPKELYEASVLDGAGPLKQFWTITWPLLSPIVFFATTMGFVGSLQEFDRAYIFSKAGAAPSDSLLLPVPELFNQAFRYFNIGYASALAWLLFLVVLILTGIQFLLSKYWVVRAE